MPRLLWQPGLDIWNAVISAALSTAVVVTAATGNATVSPVASTPTISQPAAGSGLSGAAPGAIVGQAPPGSVVEVYDGDKKLGETKADQAGNYRFSLPTLAPGQHNLTTRTNDANGNPIARSAPVPVTVSGGPVAQIAPTQAGAKPGAQAPTFTDLPQGTQWPSGMPAMLAGTAPPGSKVQVFDNDRLVTETVARQDGKWSLPLSALSTGEHFLTTRAFGPDGALLGESAPAKVTIVGPGTPTVAVRPAATAGVQVTRTAVVTSAAGTAPKATVTASFATTATRVTTATLAATAPLTGPAATAQPARPVFTGQTEGALLPPGAPLTGTATPGTKIQLFDGDKQIAETTAAPDGKWSLALPALAAGAHALTARAVGSDGSVLASSAPLSVAVGATPAAGGTPAQPVFVGLAQGLQLPPGAPLAGTATPGTKIQLFDGDKQIAETTAAPDGKWSLALPALAAGAHALTARAVGSDGSVLVSSAPLSVAVAATPAAGGTPAQPVFVGLAQGLQLPPGAPLTGTATPGTKIQLFDGDRQIAETTAGPDGKWSLALPALAAGAHALTARAVGADGSVLASSAPLSVAVGATPAAGGTPAQPVFVGLAQGLQLPPGAPLAGTATPGTKIQLFDGDRQIAETTAGPDGKWSLALPALPAGAHALTARAVGSDGSVLASSAPLSVAVAATPAAGGTPAQPVFVGLAQGLQLPPGAPLAGTATPGTKIQLFDGDRQIAETTAGPDGKWSLALPALPAGAHALTARAVGADGSVLGTSAPLSVAVGATPAAVGTPAQPVFVGLAQGLRLPPGAPLVGTATPGTKIQLFDGDKQIAETTTGPDGKWSLALPALAAGAHALTARAVGSDGSVLASSAPLSVAVGATPGTATQVAGTPSGAAVIAGTVRPTGVMTGTPQVAQPAGATTGTPGPTRPGGTAAAAPAASRPRTPSPAVGTAVAAAASAPGGAGVSLPAGAPIFLMGMADPGAKLRIFSDNTQVGETVSDALGQWRLMLPALQTGTHELIARIFDAAGKLVTSSAPLTVTILGGSAPGATPGAAAPTPGGGTPAAAGTPSAQVTTAAPPEIIGPLAGSEVPATSPGALEGKAEPGSTIRIYDGDKLVAEIVVGPDGTWRVMLPQMAEGPHTFVVRVVSPDGSEAAPSAPVLVVVRPALVTTPVPAASGAAPSAGRPSVPSPAAGGAIQSSQPLLSGSAAPGSTARIYDGNALIDETKADSAGRWYFVPPIPLAIGKHALRVASVGPDGLEAPAEVLEMVVAEGATGLKPLMFSASYGKAPSPFGLLQGTAPPGAIVVLYDGDVRVIQIPVDANGQWQYALPARTRLGLHQYSIVVTSSDGTTIYRSQPVSVRIGAAPPPFLPRTGPDD